MQASPSHRRARRGRPRFRAELLVGLLALLAQIVLPHIHRWQVAAHRDPTGALHLAASTTTLEAEHAVADHTESRCPVCQALAASHDFLLTTAHHPTPATSALVTGALLDARTAHAPARAHAPRSPPLLAA